MDTKIYFHKGQQYYLCYKNTEQQTEITTDDQAEAHTQNTLLFGIGYTKEQAKKDFKFNSEELEKLHC